MTRNEINTYLCAVLTTLAELKPGEFTPESSFYMACGSDIEKWNSVLAVLLNNKMVTNHNHCLVLTKVGREMADLINADLKKRQERMARQSRR